MSEQKDLNQLGEFGLIDHLSNEFTTIHPSTIKGIGDDAAVISVSETEAMVVSTDMLVEGIHFNLMYTPLMHLGYKSVVVNLSDICAMNAKPEQITVSLAFSSKFPLEAIEELYKGIKAACDVYKVDLVGGDTSTSYSGLTISITAIGRVQKDKITYRSGANEYDLLVVSGDLGAAYMGLQVLEREKEVFKANPDIQPDLEGFDYIIKRQLKPEARKDIVEFLAELEVVPTAMIDISDGLASEILHICKSSKVGCHIYDEKIPIDGATSLAAIDFNLDPATCALNGGEDYELLFTVKQSDYEKIKGNPHMTVIGHMTNENDGCYFIDKNGSAITLKAQGWNHFGQ
ncbi:thiamine-phosphate kinase [Crocinitomicaceae bacterium CZZ-1]|uniref:Thiamine-monophosphate kinase n=1 Tax=Taishania pollutisoli TaxID=2766479 RepID=A0A8J6TTE9_9FLAO|nr:thiamine-phosphate kinase [Taishania pollutisoli]MBC9813012.1 thiamine-phosphate kinase [Taishania pollutisoli]